MTDKLKGFLTRHDACRDGLSRLAATGAATPEEAWARADASDLVWAVTRPGVMSDDQRRKFLAEAVLAPVEDLLTDERSKNILRKLRINEQITQDDKNAAWASRAASYAASSRAAAAAAAASSYAASSRAAAAERAAQADAAAAAAADAAADAAWAAAYEAAAYAESYAAAWAESYAAAREAQARWIRENFALSDLHIN